MFLPDLLFWLVLLVIAIGNGILRQVAFTPYMTELHAHQFSTLTAILLFTLAVWLFSRWRRPATTKAAIAIGLVWVALTVAFEFLFGHYVAGHPWTALLHDYNLVAGRVWLIFLIWLGLLPVVMYRKR